MKKLFAILLAVMMMATMSVSAFAATTITEDNGNTSISVSGTYQSGGTAGEGTISVDISWSGMEFTYTGASQGTWNPESHAYDNVTNGGWSTDKGTITVKNHSNVAVTASYEFKAATGLNVSGTFYTKGEGDSYTAVATDNQKFDLATAVGTTRDDSNVENDQTPTNTIYFAITDGSITAEQTSLGTITVTIAKKTSD